MKKYILNYLKKIWHNAATLNNQVIASYIKPASYKKVLDLGCDNGVIFKQRVYGKITQSQFYGVDINIHKLKFAKKLGITPIRADVEKKLPFRKNHFDIIIANQIIEHLISTDNFIKEIYRVLKPGGYMILSTENLAAWHNITALFLGWHPFSLHASSIYNIGNPLRLGNNIFPDKSVLHIRGFTLRSLIELVKINGLHIEKSYGAGYYPFTGFISKMFSKIDPQHAAFIGLKAYK